MLTDVETAAVQILLDRTLSATVKELNAMPDKLPNVRALPDALAKMAGLLNERAGKTVDAIEKLGDRGQAVVGKFDAVVQETSATIDEVERALDGGTNGGPL